MTTTVTQVEATLNAALEELEGQAGATTLTVLGAKPGGGVVVEAIFGNGPGALATWALGCGEGAQSARLGRWCPRCPAPHHTNRLSPVANDHTCPPAGANSHAFLTDRSAVLGHLTTRGFVGPGHEREALLGVRRALVMWQDRSPRGVEVAHVLLSATGRRLSWSPEAAEWLEARWDEVASRLRNLLDDPASSPVVVDGYIARLTPMSQGRRHGHLVCFERPGALWIDWSHGLDARRLDVANMASAGHDNPHIARALGISRDTVKYHLKQTFGLLQVDSRAELAALLGPDATGCTDQEHPPHDSSLSSATTSSKRDETPKA